MDSSSTLGRMPWTWATDFVFGYLGWWFLVVLVLELAETAVMLHKFSQRRAVYR